ncbi:tetratricopeptide repeat protein [Carboxylicivirga sediminis]|uniref:Tetratricopeptide repeat protein n=1 Tax=Carboxylicivirga sediminis TaxID=2006564 RepID=A0A941J048_9BACT|nr:tetratricopeptide repeat protein [Carboxylicivirga sediminis]MBR8537177.1 tetratricopeptide repeat protein [Carboxylicivirga sediminis]
MRYLVLVLMMGFFSVKAQQSEADKFIRQGQALFGHELYQDAINKYKQAIAFDKKCVEAHYELAYTYLTIKDYDEALFYSRNVLGEKSDYWLDALLIYGAVLNNKGNIKGAIREYNKALKKYPDEYLLYYNIAESYQRINEDEKAEDALLKALRLNNNHIPSHLLLSSIMKSRGEVLKSMLPLYYCLLIEVDEEKKSTLLDDLQVRWHVAMVQKPAFAAPVSKHARVSGLKVAESKLNAIAREAVVNNPDEPYTLINQTLALFSMLNEEQTGEMDFFDIQYVDFFNQLYVAGHAQAYAYFICNAKYSTEVLLWLNDNQSQFSAFINWMELQQ